MALTLSVPHGTPSAVSLAPSTSTASVGHTTTGPRLRTSPGSRGGAGPPHAKSPLGLLSPKQTQSVSDDGDSTRLEPLTEAPQLSQKELSKISVCAEAEDPLDSLDAVEALLRQVGLSVEEEIVAETLLQLRPAFCFSSQSTQRSLLVDTSPSSSPAAKTTADSSVLTRCISPSPFALVRSSKEAAGAGGLGSDRVLSVQQFVDVCRLLKGRSSVERQTSAFVSEARADMVEIFASLGGKKDCSGSIPLSAVRAMLVELCEAERLSVSHDHQDHPHHVEPASSTSGGGKRGARQQWKSLASTTGAGTGAAVAGLSRKGSASNLRGIAILRPRPDAGPSDTPLAGDDDVEYDAQSIPRKYLVAFDKYFIEQQHQQALAASAVSRFLTAGHSSRHLQHQPSAVDSRWTPGRRKSVLVTPTPSPLSKTPLADEGGASSRTPSFLRTPGSVSSLEPMHHHTAGQREEKQKETDGDASEGEAISDEPSKKNKKTPLTVEVQEREVTFQEMVQLLDIIRSGGDPHSLHHHHHHRHRHHHGRRSSHHPRLDLQPTTSSLSVPGQSRRHTGSRASRSPDERSVTLSVEDRALSSSTTRRPSLGALSDTSEMDQLEQRSDALSQSRHSHEEGEESRSVGSSEGDRGTLVDEEEDLLDDEEEEETDELGGAVDTVSSVDVRDVLQLPGHEAAKARRSLRRESAGLRGPSTTGKARTDLVTQHHQARMKSAQQHHQEATALLKLEDFSRVWKRPPQRILMPSGETDEEMAEKIRHRNVHQLKFGKPPQSIVERQKKVQKLYDDADLQAVVEARMERARQEQLRRQGRHSALSRRSASATPSSVCGKDRSASGGSRTPTHRQGVNIPRDQLSPSRVSRRQTHVTANQLVETIAFIAEMEPKEKKMMRLKPQARDTLSWKPPTPWITEREYERQRRLDEIDLEDAIVAATNTLQKGLCEFRGEEEGEEGKRHQHRHQRYPSVALAASTDFRRNLVASTFVFCDHAKDSRTTLSLRDIHSVSQLISVMADVMEGKKPQKDHQEQEQRVPSPSRLSSAAREEEQGHHHRSLASSGGSSDDGFEKESTDSEQSGGGYYRKEDSTPPSRHPQPEREGHTATPAQLQSKYARLLDKHYVVDDVYYNPAPWSDPSLFAPVPDIDALIQVAGSQQGILRLKVMCRSAVSKH